MSDEKLGQAEPGEREWLQELVERANRGDPEAIARLRQFLDENPALWRRLGDLTGHAVAAWVELISRGDQLAKESVEREADRLRGELLGKAAGPIERLLIDQVVVLHLEIQYFQVRAAEVSGGTRGQVVVLLKRLESAQKRYFAAIKLLTVVRKLALSDDARTRLRVFSNGNTA